MVSRSPGISTWEIRLFKLTIATRHLTDDYVFLYHGSSISLYILFHSSTSLHLTVLSSPYLYLIYSTFLYILLPYGSTLTQLHSTIALLYSIIVYCKHYSLWMITCSLAVTISRPLATNRTPVEHFRSR